MGNHISSYIAIVCAITEEFEALKGLVENAKVIKSENYSFYVGTRSGKNVILLRAGEGSYAMEFGVLTLIHKFNPKAIILAGITGTNNPKIKITDVITCITAVDKSCIHYHQEGYQNQYRVGIIKANKTQKLSYLWANKYLAMKANKLQIKGVAGSSNTYTSKLDWIKAIDSLYPTDSHDNETMALAYACEVNNKPWLALRSVSDNGYTSQHPQALKTLANSVSELLANIELSELTFEVCDALMLSPECLANQYGYLTAAKSYFSVSKVEKVITDTADDDN